MRAKTSCEMCSNYVYDEDYDYYVCEMDLDEDEMYRFLSSSVDSCPYFRGKMNIRLSENKCEVKRHAACRFGSFRNRI